MDQSCDYVPQIPPSFVWTEDAHCLYLSFLEDAFVDDLYHRSYCSLDICGSSPPFTPPSSIAAESPSSGPPPPPPPSTPLPSQPKSNTDSKACRKRPYTGSKASSAKRKGKWLSHDVGLDDQLDLESSIVPDKSMSSLEQPGSSSQPFENFECVVPKRPRGGLKRPHVKGVDVKFERRGTDQVVPSVSEEG